MSSSLEGTDNEIRDLTTTLLQAVSTNVQIEPTLQSLTGEVLTGRTANREDQSRLSLDVSALASAWYPFQDTFLNGIACKSFQPTNI